MCYNGPNKAEWKEEQHTLTFLQKDCLGRGSSFCVKKEVLSKMKKDGNHSGIGLLMLLLVALLIAFLWMKNMDSVKKDSSDTQQAEDYVHQAQNLVDQINRAQQQAATEP